MGKSTSDGRSVVTTTTTTVVETKVDIAESKSSSSEKSLTDKVVERVFVSALVAAVTGGASIGIV